MYDILHTYLARVVAYDEGEQQGCDPPLRPLGLQDDQVARDLLHDYVVVRGKNEKYHEDTVAPRRPIVAGPSRIPPALLTSRSGARFWSNFT